MSAMTEKIVRDTLPNVPIKYSNGETGMATVSGRLNKFATLHFGQYGQVEVSFQTIASVLNRGSRVLLS